MSHHQSQPPHHHASHDSHASGHRHEEPQASHPAATPAATPVPVVVKRPSHDEIAKRAYDKFIARSRHNGADQEDWFKAEQELIAELNHR